MMLNMEHQSRKICMYPTALAYSYIIYRKSVIISIMFGYYCKHNVISWKKGLTDYDSTNNIKFVNDFTVFIIAGNYSVTGFEMILTRRMSHYMITYYLPSSLFVVVSWTSFLIPSEDIQGRMALLVTLFLVLVSYES